MSSLFIRKIDERKLKMLRAEFGEMTLDELIELAQQAEGFLQHMTPFDPAFEKFTRDRRRWWEYAWLVSCEHGTFTPSSPHVVWKHYLIAYPRRQRYLNQNEFVRWLHDRTDDVCVEFSCALPVYLRADELKSYATVIYHRQNGIDGNLHDVEIEELEYKD